MRGDIRYADLVLPLPLLSAEDLDRQRLIDGWHGRLAQLAGQIAAIRAAQKAQQDKQNLALKEARASMSASELYELAERLSETEAVFANRLRPVLDQFTAIVKKFDAKAELDKIDQAIHRYAEEGIDIGISWLELLQNYRIECLKLASEKGNTHSIISSSDELEREFDSILEE